MYESFMLLQLENTDASRDSITVLLAKRLAFLHLDESRICTEQQATRNHVFTLVSLGEKRKESS